VILLLTAPSTLTPSAVSDVGGQERLQLQRGREHPRGRAPRLRRTLRRLPRRRRPRQVRGPPGHGAPRAGARRRRGGPRAPLLGVPGQRRLARRAPPGPAQRGQARPLVQGLRQDVGGRDRGAARRRRHVRGPPAPAHLG
jgi:hypothetical protein